MNHPNTCGMMTTLTKIESAQDRKQLLQYARSIAAKMLRAHDEHSIEKPDIAGNFGGAFVTFWNHKSLRGCVGSFCSTGDIAQTIADVTRNSLSDSRFVDQPVSARELDALNIEISILSDAVKIVDPLTLVPGEHGLMIRKGNKSGCFLPHVATQRGWSAAAFLSNCCTMKAGLPANAWKESDTDVLVFTADVFSDRD